MSATSPTAQDTTAATLAGLPFATVRGIVETMQRAFPDEYARIGRGLQVLLTSKIVDSPRTGRYLVQSTQDGILYYEVTTLECSCPDHRRNPELRCKHSWALDVLSVASAIASRERAEQAATVAACQDADVLDLDGLCVECLAREADAIAPDAPIPFELTPQALAALAATAPPVASQPQESLSGEAACPSCGKIRRVVADGTSHRCYGCFHRWVPTLAPIVA